MKFHNLISITEKVRVRLIRLISGLVPDHPLLNGKIAASVLCFSFISVVSVAQIMPQTPNAAELGRYGQVPVSLFNGLSQISVPIHTIKLKNIEIPIQLNYYGSGIKVDQRPTWVGLGWNLLAGGSITRIINGTKDENNSRDIQHDTGIGFVDYGFGYFYNSGYLNRNDWATINSFENFFPSHSSDPNGYRDGEPDEFMINAPGISASFYLYRNEENKISVKIKSKDGRSLQVIPELQKDIRVDFYSYPVNNPPAHSTDLENILSEPFFKFTVITEDGKKYTFGGKVDAIEFVSYLSRGIVTSPTTWYLTNITDVIGKKVDFTYQRDGNPVAVNNVLKKVFSYIKGSTTGQECIQGCNSVYPGLYFALQHPIYLSQISASDGTIINLSHTKSADLPYDYEEQALDDYVEDGLDYHVINVVKNQNYWVKLDKITINNKKKIEFLYTENTNERLKLTDVVFSNIAGQSSDHYTFNYNKTPLPRYNTKMTDNWGFYNGKRYQGVDPDNMYSFRSADTALMKAEVLTSIKYPTGGKTYFEYEAHDYSKIASQFPLFEVKSGNGIAGGLRIKRIISKTDDNSTQSLIKEYSYLNESNLSSGILSGIPLYKATGRAHTKYEASTWSGLSHYRESADYVQAYYITSENFLNLLGNTNGNHVTYSMVTEKTTGNGKIVFNYTNHESFPDESPVNLYTNMDDRTMIDQFTSRELERGLLTSQKTYDQSNKAVESINLEYNSSPSRYNIFVKSVSMDKIPGQGGIPFIRMNANKIYTFYPYLKNKTVTSYSNSDSITRKEEYTYDDWTNNLRILTTKNSKGETTNIYYSYPTQMQDFEPVYEQMVSKNVISPIVTEERIVNTNKNGTIIPVSTYYKRTNFAEWVFQPSSVVKRIGTHPLDTLVKYTYDENWNIKSESKSAGASIYYLWGYNWLYPIAQITGSLYNQYAYCNFEEEFYDEDFTTTNMFVRYDPQYSADSHTGNRSMVFNDGNRLTTMYKLPIGIYTVSYWSKNGGNLTIDENVGNVNTIDLPPDNRGWQYHEVTINVRKEDYFNIYSSESDGGVLIDDVRIFPRNAQLTTYTYDPFVGVTSITDPKNQTIFYEYDQFQRLKNIKDQEGNIINTNSYNFKH